MVRERLDASVDNDQQTPSVEEADAMVDVLDEDMQEEDPKRARRRSRSPTKSEQLDDNEEIQEDEDSEGVEERDSTVPLRRTRGRPPTRGRGRGRSSRGGRLSASKDSPQDLMDDEDGGDVQTSAVDIGGEFKWRETKTINGKQYLIEDDEVVLEEDPRGEMKIDKNGNLLGGRQFKIPTFTSSSRPNKNKLYMLSIDAARAAGFRDSLYFFRRNPLLHKLNCGPAEKDRLIGEGKLHANLKSRQVTMITARNTFKIMGARFIEDGKYIIDDYYEDIMLGLGRRPGDPAYVEMYDPEHDSSTLAQPKMGVTTPSGGSSIIKAPLKGPLLPSGATDATTQFGSSGAGPFSRAHDSHGNKRRIRAGLTESNWMHEYALDTSTQNRSIYSWRHSRENAISLGEWESSDRTPPLLTNGTNGQMENDKQSLTEATTTGADGTVKMEENDTAARNEDSTVSVALTGVYEPHTNLPQVRQLFQPTRAKLIRESGKAILEDDTDPGPHGKKIKVDERKDRRVQLASVVVSMQVQSPEEEAEVVWTGVPGLWDFRGLEAKYL